MSFCPTCPKCGEFAPWVVSGREVLANDNRDWPAEEEYLLSRGEVRVCVNGHKYHEGSRKVIEAKQEPQLLIAAE